MDENQNQQQTGGEQDMNKSQPFGYSSQAPQQAGMGQSPSAGSSVSPNVGVGVSADVQPIQPIQPPPVSTAATVNQPEPSAAPPMQPQPSHSSKKLLIFVVILVVLVIALGALVYSRFYGVSTQENSGAVIPTSVPPSPTSSPTPTQTAQQKLNQLDVGNVDSDLQQIDQDLNQL